MHTATKSAEGHQVFPPVDGDLSLQTRFGDDCDGLRMLSYTLSPTSMYFQDELDSPYKTPTNFSYPRQSPHQIQNPYRSPNPYGIQMPNQNPISPSSTRTMSIPRKPIPGNYARLPEPKNQDSLDTVHTFESYDSIGSYSKLPEPQPQRSYDTVQTKGRLDSIEDGPYIRGPQHQETYTVETKEKNGSYDTIEEEKEGFTIPEKRSWRFYGTFACLALVTLVCAIDATILSVALPTIATSLKGTTAIEAFWTGTSFLLCSTVFQPSWASFSHIIGRKSVLLTALFVFTSGTVICSIANKIAVLLAGRCVQGIGGGGLVALTYCIVADMVPLRERGKWFSIISLQWAIGTVIGPVIGGTFAEKATWRWIFWLNIPFCVLAAIGIPICLRLHIKPGNFWEKLRAFDWFGSILFVAATTSFLIPLTWGGIMYDWTSWRTLVPLCLGVGGLIGFVVYSVYFSSEPLIRRSLFNTPTAISAYFGTLIQGSIVWALLYYMPLYFEVAKGYSPITSGIAIFPFTFTTAPAAVVTGLIITKTGRYRPSLWVGWFLTTLGMGLLVYLQQDTKTPAWICLSLVAGCGMGILFSAMGFAAQASVSNPDLPFAGAMYSFFRAFGQTIGVAISGTIFQNTFKKKILQTAYAMFADEWSNDAAAFVQVVKMWSTDGEEGIRKEVVITAYVESLRMVWTIMCILSAVAFLASVLWTAELSMDRDLETEQGFVHDNKQQRQSSKMDADLEQGTVFDNRPHQSSSERKVSLAAEQQPILHRERMHSVALEQPIAPKELKATLTKERMPKLTKVSSRGTINDGERKPSFIKVSRKGTVYNANDIDILLARGFEPEDI